MQLLNTLKDIAIDWESKIFQIFTSHSIKYTSLPSPLKIAIFEEMDNKVFHVFDDIDPCCFSQEDYQNIPVLVYENVPFRELWIKKMEKISMYIPVPVFFLSQNIVHIMSSFNWDKEKLYDEIGGNIFIPDKKYRDILLSIAKKSHMISKFIEPYNITIKFYQLLNKFTEEELNLLVLVFKNVKFSLNSTRQILIMLNDIKRKESVVKLLKVLQEKLDDVGNKDVLIDKKNLIIQHITSIRYPFLTERKKMRECFIKSLNIPDTISIYYDEVLEKDCVDIVLRIRHQHDVNDAVNNLQKIFDEENQKNLVKLI